MIFIQLPNKATNERRGCEQQGFSLRYCLSGLEEFFYTLKEELLASPAERTSLSVLWWFSREQPAGSMTFHLSSGLGSNSDYLWKPSRLWNFTRVSPRGWRVNDEAEFPFSGELLQSPNTRRERRGWDEVCALKEQHSIAAVYCSSDCVLTFACWVWTWV